MPFDPFQYGVVVNQDWDILHTFVFSLQAARRLFQESRRYRWLEDEKYVRDSTRC